MGILRALFGPSQGEVWAELAQQVGGRFDDGGFFGTDRVDVVVGPWTITLDTYTVQTGKSSVTYTRMRAPYVNADHFHFTVYHTGIFTAVGRALGLQDIEVGDPTFDREFVVKGNSEPHARAFFKNPEIRRRLLQQSAVKFEIKDNEGWFSGTPDGVDILSFERRGIMKDRAELEALFALFAESLEQLCRIGSAYKNDPRHPEYAPPLKDGYGVATEAPLHQLEQRGASGALTGAPVAMPVLLPNSDDS